MYRLRGGQTHNLAVKFCDPTHILASPPPPPHTLASSTGSSTPTRTPETAQTLFSNAHYPGENKPFTAGIVVHIRRKDHGPSDADRLHTQGLLTANQILRNVSDAARSTIKELDPIFILNSHKANDKNERLYQPPIPGDPRYNERSPQKTSSHPTRPAGGAL